MSKKRSTSRIALWVVQVALAGVIAVGRRPQSIRRSSYSSTSTTGQGGNVSASWAS